MSVEREATVMKARDEERKRDERERETTRQHDSHIHKRRRGAREIERKGSGR